MPNTRGLPFNAPYACTAMHKSVNALFVPLLFPTIHTKHNHGLNQGVAPPGLTHLTYRWRERASGSVARKTSEANRLCTSVYVLISATKKGGWCVRAVVMVAPHCTAEQDRKPPVTNTAWPKAIIFALISPLIIVQSSNLSLYSMFALQHGESWGTGDKQCACCTQSNKNV